MVRWMWYARLVRAAVELDPPVEAQGTEGRAVAQAQPGAVAEVGEAHVGDERVDVADVDEGGKGEGPPHVVTQLAAAQEQAAAPGGKEIPVRAELLRAHGVDGEAAQGVVAPGEEALGQGQLGGSVRAEGGGQTDASGEGEGQVAPEAERSAPPGRSPSRTARPPKTRIEAWRSALTKWPRRASRGSSRVSSRTETEGPARV